MAHSQPRITPYSSHSSATSLPQPIRISPPVEHPAPRETPPHLSVQAPWRPLASEKDFVLRYLWMARRQSSPRPCGTYLGSTRHQHGSIHLVSVCPCCWRHWHSPSPCQNTYNWPETKELSSGASNTANPREHAFGMLLLLPPGLTLGLRDQIAVR